MIVYRIDRLKRSADVLSGRGAELYGGRWNLPGTPTVYTAGSRSLAILEMLVHLDYRSEMPLDRILVSISIPDELIRKCGVLPLTWDATPPQLEGQMVFTQFASSDYTVLEVPSAIVPQEYNYLINPHGKEFSRITILAIEDLDLDQRLGIPQY